METRQLLYFKTVAEIEHVTKAAESLYISQPTLSLAIRRLEEELGVPLFERKGRNVCLNEYGKIFYEEATPALEHLKNARNRLAELKNLNDNKVSIIAPSLFVFPGMMDKVYEMFPDIRITRIDSSSIDSADQIVHMLTNHDVDICLSIAKVSGSGIEGIKLCDEPMVVLVSEKHPLAERDSVSLEELANELFVADMKGTTVRSHMEELFAKVGVVPKIAYETRSDKDIHLCVASGKYISLVPSINGVSGRVNGLKRLKISSPVSDTKMTLYHMKDTKEREIVASLVRILVDYFAENFPPEE